MKKIWSLCQPYIRWVILGGTLFFLGEAFLDHWEEIAAIRFGARQWAVVALALVVTFMAHVWSALVCYILLRSFRQPVDLGWVVQVYLKTNIAKYLPGNVWHLYGRIQAVKSRGSNLSAAIMSVLLEPILMAAAALILALVAMQLGVLAWNGSQVLPLVGLGVVLVGIHPRFLNRILQVLGRSKAKKFGEAQLYLKQYPLVPLLGECVFVLIRGTGFVLVMSAFFSLSLSQVLLLYSAFSWAWCLGLVVPTPGGLGVFETSAIALLGSQFPAGLLLSSLALFRGVSILAEAVAALLAWLKSEFKNL
jgi:uncharacterized membrane protein YbhN (UPF0104 family)